MTGGREGGSVGWRGLGEGGLCGVFLPDPFEGRKRQSVFACSKGSLKQDWQLGLIQPFISELALEELMNNKHSLLHVHQAPHPIVCPGNFIFLFVHLSAPTCLPLPLMWSDTVLGSVTGRGRERSGRDQILERMKGLQ